jgi:hypothetical protein
VQWNVLRKHPPEKIDWSTSPKDDEPEEAKSRASVGDWITAILDNFF